MMTMCILEPAFWFHQDSLELFLRIGDDQTVVLANEKLQTGKTVSQFAYCIARFANSEGIGCIYIRFGFLLRVKSPSQVAECCTRF